MHSNYNPELFPGVYVINEKNQKWGVGQIQSSINNKVTINFENVGKKVVDIKKFKLKVIKL